MKLIRCEACDDPVALSTRWRSCRCGATGGVYREDGDKAVVAGPCGVYGVSNLIFHGITHRAWPYDESKLSVTDGLPKIVRLERNPGSARRALQRARVLERSCTPDLERAYAQAHEEARVVRDDLAAASRRGYRDSAREPRIPPQPPAPGR